MTNLQLVMSLCWIHVKPLAVTSAYRLHFDFMHSNEDVSKKLAARPLLKQNIYSSQDSLPRKRNLPITSVTSRPVDWGRVMKMQRCTNINIELHLTRTRPTSKCAIDGGGPRPGGVGNGPAGRLVGWLEELAGCRPCWLAGARWLAWPGWLSCWGQTGERQTKTRKNKPNELELLGVNPNCFNLVPVMTRLYEKKLECGKVAKKIRPRRVWWGDN